MSLISVSELDLDLLYNHFSKPKGYIFPVQLSKVRPPLESSWSSQLITLTKIEQFYDQQPWDLYDQTIHPISFKPSGWFDKLVEAYEGFVIAIAKLCGNRPTSCGSPMSSVKRILDWPLLCEQEGRDDLVLAPAGSEYCS